MTKRVSSFTNKISKSLGSENSYAISTTQFDPSLLNPIPREDARKDWDIKGNSFQGIDVWHCHEATFLTDSGIPVAGTVKLAYPSSTIDMVESKSMKLYFNSFDMCHMGKTIDQAIENYEKQIKTDLSDILKCDVSVKFFTSGSDLLAKDSFFDYTDLFEKVKSLEMSVEINDYIAEEQHIRFTPSQSGSQVYKLSTNVLRSRCRHTKQKDTGTAYVYIKTKEGFELDIISLFEEIVSLREVNEFHEFCAEKFYTTIMLTEAVSECCVTLLYSRRGSLDINPTRASSIEILPQLLIDVTTFTKKTQGQ